jgi:hypothetical protein
VNPKMCSKTTERSKRAIFMSASVLMRPAPGKIRIPPASYYCFLRG